MQVLFIVLNKTQYLDEILCKFVEVGVRGATVLDSQGMAGAIVDTDLPMFGFLKGMLEDSKPYNKTIFTVIKSQEMLDKTIHEITELLGEDAKNGAIFMFTIPVGNVYRFD